jgi:eukaryotic-like serine/threonine-protein kinase
MALAPGTKLGPYEIVSPLGAGGMGEVYRARDTRLNRDVAIKLLGESFSRDPDRLQRFQQEAQATATLNHPNVLAIFDLGDYQGSPFLVSELLEGETLRSHLRSGALPLRKAIEYATQVTRGLAATHAKGIVHRDLKPENIFITKDGHAKILDFGLAKLTRAEGTNSGNSETIAFGTEAGMVLGTIGYMSPEQVRGEVADSRSDIFAFGVILHELLSGRQAFQKASSADTMAAILKDDPPSIDLTHPTSPALERIVQHCLEKDPAHRFQSAQDLAFDLESLSGSASTASFALGVSHSNRTTLKWGSIAALTSLAALAVGFAIGHRRPPPSEPVWQRLTYGKGTVLSARFAPDGHTVVYSAAWNGKPSQLFTTRPESPESRPLGLESTELLALSEKGEMAVITRIVASGEPGEGYKGTLARVPLEGGAPREVLPDVQGADWTTDNTNLVVTRSDAGTSVLEFPIGHPLYKANGFVSKAHMSPRGDSIAFLDVALQEHNSVMMVDFSGHAKALSRDWTDLTGLAWSPDGREIWFTGSRTNGSASLYAVTPEGRERVVAHIPGELNLFDVNRDGRVLLGLQSWRNEILGLLPGEKQERDLSWFDFSVPDALSSDGRTLLFHEAGEAGGRSWTAYLRTTDGSPPVRLSEGACLALSPDRGWAVCSPASGVGALVLTPTRAGTPRTLPDDHRQYFGAMWFPDGTRLLLVGNDAGHGARAYILNLESGASRAVSPEGIDSAALSPDGTSIAVSFGAVYPVDGRAPRMIPGWTIGDSFVGWGKDGRNIFILRRGEFPTPIFRLNLATGKRELWKSLSPPDPSGVRDVRPVFISADEKTLIYSPERRLTDLYVVQGLR